MYIIYYIQYINVYAFIYYMVYIVWYILYWHKDGVTGCLSRVGCDEEHQEVKEGSSWPKGWRIGQAIRIGDWVITDTRQCVQKAGESVKSPSWKCSQLKHWLCCSLRACCPLTNAQFRPALRAVSDSLPSELVFLTCGGLKHWHRRVLVQAENSWPCRQVCTRVSFLHRIRTRQTLQAHWQVSNVHLDSTKGCRLCFWNAYVHLW